jgi:ubiquinone/menaquinone biosynthesis C-methylase UbiE
MSTYSERSLREKERYNTGLKRGRYDKMLSHAGYYYGQRREGILLEHLQYANGRIVLELGSHCWIRWLQGHDIRPRTLQCINISEKELQKGIDAAKRSAVKPVFSLMDANRLQFPDESFDMVFGDAILHHLDFSRAVDEIHRVLKPEGRIVFTEPLGINPIGKIVRSLTPRARTRDEQPLRMKELAQVSNRFETTCFYEQLLSVPLGVVSRMVSRHPDNALMKTAFHVDRFIDSNAPALRKLYRYIILVGVRKPASLKAASI